MRRRHSRPCRRSFWSRMVYSKSKQAALCVLLVAACLAQAPRTQPAKAASPAEISSRLTRASALADSGRIDAARAEYERALKEGGAAQIEADFDQARRLGLCYLNGSPQKLGEAARWFEAANRVK